MADFKPNTPYNIPAVLLVPTSERIKGMLKKTYPETGSMIFISFRTFGGTERTENDMIVVENTAIVETWFRPDISADCRLIIEGVPYEILGTPENINLRNQWVRFKARAISGGA